MPTSFLVKRIHHISDLITAKTTYYTLFESHLRYKIGIWRGITVTNLHKLLLIQNKNSFKGLELKDSCRECFKDLRILTVVALYILEVIMCVDKNEFPQGTDVHQPVHHSYNYILPAHNLSLYGRKPSYMGRSFTICCQPEIKIKNGMNLKMALNKWLVTRLFYTLEEYLKTILNIKTAQFNLYFDSKEIIFPALDKTDIQLMGFSKGCVVLNQFIYEFHYCKTLTPEDDSMCQLIPRIRHMFWLDGGHAGGKNTWITSRSLLETLTRLARTVHSDRMGSGAVHYGACVHTAAMSLLRPHQLGFIFAASLILCLLKS
ncbi:hypothetical protein J6590_045070 [Homalodisca vitripennis]|nr:hypothetical protein J6590_045070 [Homalodisca vitripennis]